MKLKTSQRVHYDSGPNMTPLVDVVMVLLIFLMLTGSFVGAEHYLASNVPARKSGTGGVTAGVVPDDNDLPVIVDQLSTGDGFISLIGSVQASDRATLAAVLRKKHDEYARSGVDPSRITIVISATAAVKYKYIVAVFESANEAGFDKITFQSRTKRS